MGHHLSGVHFPRLGTLRAAHSNATRLASVKQKFHPSRLESASDLVECSIRRPLKAAFNAVNGSDLDVCRVGEL